MAPEIGAADVQVTRERSSPAADAAGARLPRSMRIRKRAEFVRIQTGGAGQVVRASAAHFLLLSPVEPGESGLRLGIVASRRVGGAVARNRAKRLVREVFRRMKDVFPHHADVVVIVRPGAAGLDYARVRSELARAAAKLSRALRDAHRGAPRKEAAPSPEREPIR